MTSYTQSPHLECSVTSYTQSPHLECSVTSYTQSPHLECSVTSYTQSPHLECSVTSYTQSPHLECSVTSYTQSPHLECSVTSYTQSPHLECSVTSYTQSPHLECYFWHFQYSQSSLVPMPCPAFHCLYWANTEKVTQAGQSLGTRFMTACDQLSIIFLQCCTGCGSTLHKIKVRMPADDTGVKCTCTDTRSLPCFLLYSAWTVL